MRESQSALREWSIALDAHSRNSIFIFVVILGLFGSMMLAPATASAMENAVCTSCHGATMSMSVAPVSRDTACKACHLGFAGAHPYHQVGANCGAACHPGWGDALLTATPRYTDPVSGAAFATATSKNTPASALHAIHSAARWPANAAATSSACASCHSVVACNACHTGAISSAHASHASTGNGSLTAQTPWTGTIGYGVVGGDQRQRTSFSDAIQCASAGCHDLPSTQAARPTFVEDYNYAVGGNPKEPAQVSSAISMTGTWRVRANTLYTGNRMSYNNVAGSTITAAFTGRRVEVVSDKDPYRGQAEVLVDGAVVGSFDGYAPSTQTQAVVFGCDVSAGPHTITIRPTGIKTGAARGTFVVLDAVNVYPTARTSIAPDCTSCHSAKAPDHGARNAHNAGLATWCTSCHADNLMAIHEAQNDAQGQPLGCIICHGTADATVKAAVLAKDKSCTACHVPHATQHANTWTTCAGVGCHNGGNLVVVHTPVGCACHSSVDVNVTSAITLRDKNCIACHNPMLTHGAEHEASATFAAPVKMPPHGDPDGSGYMIKCLSCHRTNLLANHGSDYTNCSVCHLSGGPRSGLTTWDKTCITGGCHPGTSAPHPASYIQHKHNTFGSGVQPEGLCQGCHANPEGWQCGAPFGCHANAVGPATSVDYLAPVTSITRRGTGPITWDIAAIDAGDGLVATYYSFDGAPFALYGASEKANGIVNPADEVEPFTHTIRFYSVDAAGNVEGIRTHSYNATDFAPPTVTFSGVTVGESVYTTSTTLFAVDPKVNGRNTGVARVDIEFIVFSGVWGNWTMAPLPLFQPWGVSYPADGSWDTTRAISGLEAQAKTYTSGNFHGYQTFSANNGRYAIRYWATDYAGNVSAPTTATIIIDNAVPVTSHAPTSAGAFRWKLTASDMSPVETYYSFDGGPFQVYSSADASAGIVNTEPGGDNLGSHNLRYYSVDALGHTESIKTYNYTIVETTPPMATLSSTMTSSSVWITMWDPEGTVQRSGIKSIVGNVKQGTTTKSITTTFPAGDPAAVRSIEVTVPSDGNWELIYYVYDWSNNSTWYYQSFYRDTTPPSSGMGGWWNTSWQMSAGDGFGSGVAAHYYSFDGAPYTQVIYTGAFVYFTTPPEIVNVLGPHSLSYYAVDNYGFAETPKTISWTR